MDERGYELPAAGSDPLSVLAADAAAGAIVYLTRGGRRVAAVVPAAVAEAVEQAEDAEDLLAADAAMDAIEAGEPTVPAGQLRAELDDHPTQR